MTHIPERLRRLVRERAQGRCEYCLIHDDTTLAPHEPDHVLAEKHGGLTTAENLAWACFRCNRHKGSDLASIDLVSQKTVLLFNPRTQQWRRHFKLNGPHIDPISAAGRVTVALLRLNAPNCIKERLLLMETGHYP